MKRIPQTERPDRAEKLEAIGLSFHAWDDYWNEGVAYEFTMKQVDEIEAVTNELHDMCKAAVDHVVKNNLYSLFGIPADYWLAIRSSWLMSEPCLYGRFDLAYDGVNPPKMLEYNADTPTSLLESAVAQWYWMEETHAGMDQFNSIHERLVRRWQQIMPANVHKDVPPIYFASMSNNEEDWVCVHYLMDTAVQAGFDVRHIYMDQIGWDVPSQMFVDGDNNPIPTLFKLYPWEWMMKEDFGRHTLTCRTDFIEPMWKTLLSSKAILPVLWSLYPDHPNLLPAFSDSPHGLTSFAKKPLYSREGANIELWKEGRCIAVDAGPYGNQGYVYQQLFDLPCFEGNYPIIGSWVIGEESAGICVREDTVRITTNMSHFVPHYIK